VLIAQLETPRERYDKHSSKFSLNMKPSDKGIANRARYLCTPEAC
jgi:hypothetical protein